MLFSFYCTFPLVVLMVDDPLDESKTSQDPGFVEKLTATMIRNIQITIKNIHIRYEDAVSHMKSLYNPLISIMIVCMCVYISGD